MTSKTDDVHVMPNYGPPHDSSDECWCEPEVEYTDPDTDRTVWLHKELQ